MRSGIVYFDEIVQEIKDYTGLENMRPLYPRIKRFIFKVEQDIGAGGLMVLKSKTYTKGDEFYDGTRIVLPADFLSEWSYGALSNGSIQGNIFQLTGEGTTELEFKYLGLVLDSEGNPFTTRNRLEAVAKYAQYRFYGQRWFLGKGSERQYLLYKSEYDNAVMESRGNDVFPTEEEWNEIGTTLRGGMFEAMTDCGMKTITSVAIEDTTPFPADPICVGDLIGISNAKASVNGVISFWELKQITGAINGSSSSQGVIFNSGIIPGEDRALFGVSNASSNVSGILLEKIIIVQCNESFTYSGGPGTFSFKLVLGEGIGLTGLSVSPYGVPDRFRIEWNGVEVANSKFIGMDASGWKQALLDLGYTEDEMDLGLSSVSDQLLLFNKTAPTPNFAVVYVDAPLSNTLWKVDGVCPS